MRRCVLLALLLMSLTSCWASDSAHHRCSPGYTDQNFLGSLSAQQRGPGYGVQWGVYPKASADRYVVNVYVGDKRVDAKDQGYPPHGSVNARDVKSGASFRLEGEIHSPNLVQTFFLQCELA
jgi:hypothetical protein